MYRLIPAEKCVIRDYHVVWLFVRGKRTQRTSAFAAESGRCSLLPNYFATHVVAIDSGNVKMFLVSAGIALSYYDAAFKSKHQLCVCIMKRFGFGQRLMETRILMEVEEMIKRVREQQGRPFDVTQLTMSCIANVIASMLFGYRFDHSDSAFQQLISDIHYLSSTFFVALHLFPALRFLPHFKTAITEHSKALRNNLDFINDNIAACTQVSNGHLYCRLKGSYTPDPVRHGA